MKKLGGQCVYPIGKHHDYNPEVGLTYRQYLAAQMAGHMAANNAFTSALGERTDDADKAVQWYGASVWIMVDAVLEAENPPGHDEI